MQRETLSKPPSSIATYLSGIFIKVFLDADRKLCNINFAIQICCISKKAIDVLLDPIFTFSSIATNGTVVKHLNFPRICLP